MPFASIPAAEQTTGRDKRRLIAIAVAVLLVLAAIGVWAAVRPGAYGASKDGCITVNMPASMGGSLLHQCGSPAKSTCHRAFTSSGMVQKLTRPQCKLAGLGPVRE
jgi:hypothetical protein